MIATFDANIFVYAVDLDAGSHQSDAIALLERAALSECIVLMQAIGEFFHATTRKRMISPADANRVIAGWRAVFRFHVASVDCLRTAIDAVDQHQLQFWDAMLWAAAREAGCQYVFSEDFQDGRQLGGVAFVNPFDARNAGLVDTILPPPT